MTRWLAQASGPGQATLEWTVTSGEFVVVLANSDGTAGIDARVRAATRIPGLAAVGWGLLGGATAAMLLAVVLVVVGASGLGRRLLGPV